MSRTDEIRPDLDPQGRARSRSPEDIEREIAAARERMDRTLDELEYRLSPGQMASTVRETVRDVLEGNPENRLAMAIRNNPIPVALIGVGVLWLAFAAIKEGRSGAAASPVAAPTAEDLGRLAASVRSGALTLREAAAGMPDTAFGSVLESYALEYERAAAVVESELRRLVPASAAVPVPFDDATANAWNDLRRAAPTHDRAAVLRAGVQGSTIVLEAFRKVLHHDMPEGSRVALGAQFHVLEQAHNRLAALDQAA